MLACVDICCRVAVMETTVASDVVSQLGSTVREERRRLHLTQAELAEQSGVSRSFVIELERGHERAELGKVIAVLSALGLEVSAVTRTRRDQELSTTQRAQALGEVVEGWKKGRAVPDEATQDIVWQYIAGTLSIDAAIEQIDRLPVPGIVYLDADNPDATASD